MELVFALTVYWRRNEDSGPVYIDHEQYLLDHSFPLLAAAVQQGCREGELYCVAPKTGTAPATPYRCSWLYKVVPTAAMMSENTPSDRFFRELSTFFTQHQSDPAYAMAFKTHTPVTLARRVTDGLLNGTADKDGEGVKTACKRLGIKHTYKAIKEYLES